jgi:hypothetical protein
MLRRHCGAAIEVAVTAATCPVLNQSGAPIMLDPTYQDVCIRSEQPYVLDEVHKDCKSGDFSSILPASEIPANALLVIERCIPWSPINIRSRLPSSPTCYASLHS